MPKLCHLFQSTLKSHAAEPLRYYVQVLAGQECSEKADIWSLGVVLWEIVTGERPHLRQLRPLRYFHDQSTALDMLTVNLYACHACTSVNCYCGPGCFSARWTNSLELSVTSRKQHGQAIALAALQGDIAFGSSQGHGSCLIAFANACYAYVCI